jgi:hypothetical protein
LRAGSLGFSGQLGARGFLCLTVEARFSVETLSIPSNRSVRSLIPVGTGFFAVGDFLQWCDGDPDSGYECQQLDFDLVDDRQLEISVFMQELVILD